MTLLIVAVVLAFAAGALVGSGLTVLAIGLCRGAEAGDLCQLAQAHQVDDFADAPASWSRR